MSRAYEMDVSYVGNFNVDNQVIICDPHINPIVLYEEKIPARYNKVVRIENLLPGVYNCYHLMESNVTGDVVFFCAVNENKTVYDVIESTRIFSGYTSSFFGSGIAVMDECYRNDSRYNYFQMDLDALFDAYEFEKRIQEFPYSKDILDEFTKLSKECISNKKCVSGKDIMQILQCEPIWNGFRDFGENSNLWSAEVEKNLESSYTGCVNIKGGIATKVNGTGYFKCYTCNDSVTDETFGILIDMCGMDEQDISDLYS